MSRIAGIIYPSAFQVTEMIRGMHATLPSASSFQYFRYKNIELGGWESCIVTNEAKNIWALFDGDIYNKQGLRNELKKLGFKFTTESDTELIVHAYDAWKENFLQRLNGPFALAVFDEQKEILLLARDRLGQKPLYWTSQGKYWLFSTEVKGLVATGVVPQTPSTDALASYLYFGFIPQDLSAIRGVNKLLPCHYLKVNLKQQSVIEQYWSFSALFKTKKSLSKKEACEQLGKQLEEAVHCSIPQDGKIGSFLAGNLGSSAMMWFLSHVTKRERIRTYSAIFDETNSAELKISSEIAQNLSLNHEAKKIKPDEALDELPKIIWHLDEPVADPLVIQAWHLGKLASSKCSFVYTDLGWEEMLGGSSRYFVGESKNRYPKPSLAFFLARLPKRFRDQFLLPPLKLIGCNYFYRILRNIDINREQVTYLMESALFKGKERKKVSPNLYYAFDPEAFTQRFHHLSSLSGSINPLLYYDAKTKLPDRLLILFERLLNSHAIRVINPFLDYHLVELLAKVPEEIKFESKVPGALLHHLMKKLCHTSPPYFEHDDTFMDTWRSNARFHAVFERLLKGRLVDEGIVSGRWIRQKLSCHCLPLHTFKQLWAILTLEIWFRLYISRPIDMANITLTTEDFLSH